MRQIVCVDSQLFFLFWHRNILIASDGNVMFYLQRQTVFCTKSARWDCSRSHFTCLVAILEVQ